MGSEIAKAYRAAFPTCTPVIMGFLALGISCGLFTVVHDLPGWFAPLMSVVIFGGSLEFVTVTMLVGSFAPLEAIVIAFMIQLRHLFYGISMLRKYKGARGLKKAYLVYALTDEAFSTNHVIDPPEGVDRDWYYIAVSSLYQFSWIVGTTAGALIGPFIPFDISGLGFVMTALFTVILVEQILKVRRIDTALIGFASSIVCLFVFGSGSFLIPTLVLMLVLLFVFRKHMGKGVR